MIFWDNCEPMKFFDFGLNSNKDFWKWDVRAEYNYAHGGRFIVGYQVKQHEGTIDETAFRQLKILLDSPDKFPEKQRIDMGCVVTTALNISEDAEMLLQSEDKLILVNRDKLIEWILGVGLNAFSTS